MATKINYGTKAPFQDKPEIPVSNKATANDMNEIKEAVNGNADELDTAKEDIENLQRGQGTNNTDITDLKNRVSTLEGDNKTNKTNINNLKTDNETNKSNIQELQKDNTTNKQDISDIKEEQQTQNNNIKNLQKNDAQQDKSIEALQKENEAIKEENKRLRQDFNAFPSGQAEGEYITLNDSADSRFNMFRVGGNSKQETREGYNLLNVESKLEITGRTSKIPISLKSGVAYTIKADDIITNEENPTTFAVSFRNSSDEVIRDIGLTYSAKKETNIIFTQNIDHVYLYSSNSYANSQNVTTTFTNLMIYEGTDDKGYELYGAMPSPEYPSEIQNVEDNLNITVCNKNFFKILNNINRDYITVNGDNTFTINGTLQKNNSFVFSNMKLKKGTYTFSLGDYSKIKNCYYNIRDINTQEEISFFNYNDKNVKIDKDRYLEISFVIMAGTYNNVLITPQIEAGENKTAWIEHKEQNFIFPLQEGQRLMLGDYLAKDGIHHKRKQYEFDGTESFTRYRNYPNSYGYRFNLSGVKTNTNVLCTKYKYTPFSDFYNEETDVAGEVTTHNSSDNLIYFGSSKATAEEFKEEIKGSILEYKMLEEEIEPYTEEQQKAYNEIVQTAKSYKNVTNIYSPDPVSPVFSINYRKDIDAYIDNKLANVNAQILNIAGGN